MLELISIVASLVVLILTPIQTSQIVAGKIPPKFTGKPQAYAAAFRKQISLLIWLGAVFAVLNLILIFISTEPGEWIVKLVAGLLWAGVSGVSYFSSQKLAKYAAALGSGVSAGTT